MALQKCGQQHGLNLDAAQRELKPHGTLAFPCTGYLEPITDRPEDAVSWHWHDELEVIHIVSGTLLLKIPAREYCLRAGDGAVLNAGVLHHAAAAPRCELHSLVFHPALVAGSADSVYARKYLQPLLACAAFDGFFLDGRVHAALLQDFDAAFDALARETPGYEFTVREKLSHICLYLYGQFAPCAAAVGREPDDLRIKKMLDCIHRNFSRRLTLAEIARAADIGQRECLRCFDRMVHTSPGQYLLKYRVQQGAVLLQTPARSVSEIALQCGFDSPSNFSRTFRRFFCCTPTEYRARAGVPAAVCRPE